MGDWKERALEAIGLPDDVMGNELHIAMQGNRKAQISGVRAVKRYAPDSLRLSVVGGVLQIDGFELLIGSISPGYILVRGRFDQVSFEMEEQA